MCFGPLGFKLCFVLFVFFAFAPGFSAQGSPSSGCILNL